MLRIFKVLLLSQERTIVFKFLYTFKHGSQVNRSQVWRYTPKPANAIEAEAKSQV